MYTRCDNATFANFVPVISRANSNWFEIVRLIAATKFFPSDNDFHKINLVPQGKLLQRLVPGTCRSDLSPSVSRPLKLTMSSALAGPVIVVVSFFEHFVIVVLNSWLSCLVLLTSFLGLLYNLQPAVFSI